MIHLTSKIANKALVTRNIIRCASTCASNVWSTSLSFASPESDFTAEEFRSNVYEMAQDKANIWSNSLSFTSPESDFTADKLRNSVLSHMEKNESDRSNLAYSLSFAQAESDYTSLLLTNEMKEQLSNVKPLYEAFESPLPTTLDEALEASNEAIVITEITPPFNVVTVNKAWEDLCGYTKAECNGQSLRMIQGPETDLAAVETLMEHVLTGETAGTVLTNYKKGGKKFRNRVRVGPLFGENGDQITHLIGVLREIQDNSVNRSMMM